MSAKKEKTPPKSDFCFGRKEQTKKIFWPITLWAFRYMVIKNVLKKPVILQTIRIDTCLFQNKKSEIDF